MGARLDGACDRNVGTPNPLEVQSPVVAGYSRVEMATAPENAAVALAYVAGTAAERERMLATEILVDVLCGSNEAPLKRAVLEAGLGDELVPIFADNELQPRLVLVLKGAKEGVAKKFRTLVEDTCRDLCEQGIDRERIAASLAQVEFILREQDFGSYPAGIAISMQAMASWLYDDDHPVDYLHYEEPLAHIKAGIDNGYFEQLLRELVCESIHSAEVELVPVEEGAGAEEAAELAKLRSAMDDEDISRICDEVQALREEQEAPDSPEALATLPRLTIADIEPPKPEERPSDVKAPLPCIAHELKTRGIDYAYHFFDLRHLSYEELPYVGVLSDLLGKLATQNYRADQLDTLVQLNLGTLSFFTDSYSHADDRSYAAPTLVCGASALSEKVEQLARIPSEVWSHTLFDDTERIHALLQQRRIAMEQRFVNAGHACAVTRLSTYWSAAIKAADMLSGIEYYKFLKGLLADWDANKDELVKKLEDLAPRVFTASNVITSFTGSANDRERYWKCGGTLGLVAASSISHRMQIPQPHVRNEAFVIPSNVSYVGAGSAPVTAHDTSEGSWHVARRVLSYEYLWNEVRVKGGAYGCGFRYTNSGLTQFWSYRDPNVDATLARYDETAAWLDSWQPSEEELTGYIVSTISSHDAPTKPRALALRQDILRFSGKPVDWRDQLRAEELATTVEDLRAVATPLTGLADERAVCVFGPREAIEASDVAFDEVIDLLG